MFVKMTKIGRYSLPLIKDMGCFPSNFIPLDRGIVRYGFRVKHSMTKQSTSIGIASPSARNDSNTGGYEGMK